MYEGADAAWLDHETVLLAEGLRTNREGARQVRDALREMGVEVLMTRMNPGAMHLMGQLRFLDRDLAVILDGRVAPSTMDALRSRGYRILEVPQGEETIGRMALNFVTLGPRRILMGAGNPSTQEKLEREGVHCVTVQIEELIKGAGGIGCMTGVLART